jgi:hypothetical protein
MDQLWPEPMPETRVAEPSAIQSFERACELAERAGVAAQSAAKRLDRAAKAIEVAARSGDPAKLRNAADELKSAVADARTPLDAALTAWPYSDEAVSDYLAGDYGRELVDTARSLNVKLDRLDDRWTAFPVVLEVVPKGRAAKVDGKRVTSLRPGVLVDLIRRRQSAKGARPDRFIEILHSGYKAVAQPLGVHLVNIYDLLTILPDARAGYSRADFARDVYLLDTSPVRQTKSGATIEFKGSTGAKGSAKALTVIPPEGMPKHYYAVSFRDPE